MEVSIRFEGCAHYAVARSVRVLRSRLGRGSLARSLRTHDDVSRGADNLVSFLKNTLNIREIFYSYSKMRFCLMN